MYFTKDEVENFTTRPGERAIEDYDSSLTTSLTYEIYQKEVVLPFTTYTLSSASDDGGPYCEYGSTWELSITPAFSPGAKTFYEQLIQDGSNWMEQEGGDRLSVYSASVQHSSQYLIKTTFRITDYGTEWPEDPSADTYEEVELIDNWTLELVSPCGDDTKLLTTFEEMYLYAVIGNGAATYEFINFSDTKSAIIDVN